MSDLPADALADLLFGSTDAVDDDDHDHRGTDGAARDAQLCAQVADALLLSLATAQNRALRDLTVAAVVPRRGSACLEVRLEASADADLHAIDRQVQRAVGWLRSEVADAIERKRVPELVVIIVPATDDPEVTP